jgi:hypothetical protein
VKTEKDQERDEYATEFDATPDGRRFRYAVMALSVTRNKLRLIASPLAASTVVMAAVMLPFAPYNELLVPVAAFVSGVAIGTIFSGLLYFWPPLGREYLERIERVFGPKTRAKIWDGYNPLAPAERIDVIQIAKTVGEYRLED